MTKVHITKARREAGWRYYVNQAGDLARRSIKPNGKTRVSEFSGRVVEAYDIETVEVVGLRRHAGFFYFVDSDLDISCYPQGGL